MVARWKFISRKWTPNQFNRSLYTVLTVLTTAYHNKIPHLGYPSIYLKYSALASKVINCSKAFFVCVLVLMPARVHWIHRRRQKNMKWKKQKNISTMIDFWLTSLAGVRQNLTAQAMILKVPTSFILYILFDLWIRSKMAGLWLVNWESGSHKCVVDTGMRSLMDRDIYGMFVTQRPTWLIPFDWANKTRVLIQQVRAKV